MKTSKIKLVSVPSEYNNTHGTFYYFQIELENGDKGSIGSKSQSPEWLKEGLDLTYEIQDGNRIKRVQEKKQGYKPDTLGIAIGQGLNLAVEMYVNDKIDKDGIEPFAKWIAERSYKLRSELSYLDK